MAIGAIAGLRDLDLNLSTDLSFVAFDDFPLAAYWSPRITVVRQDVDRLAEEAVRMLLARIENPSSPLENIRVAAALEWRESIANLTR